jgi:hypothetical protein
MARKTVSRDEIGKKKLTGRNKPVSLHFIQSRLADA